MNATTTRTDIHRPSAPDFDPQAYDLAGVFDAACPASRAILDETVEDLYGQAYHLGHGSDRKCGHCGTAIRYSALLVRDDVQQFIFVGEQCLDNRFQALTKEQFRALREQARLNRERATLQERIDATVAEHDCVRRLVTEDVGHSHFLSDVRRKFLASGRLSENQIRAVGNSFAGDERRRQWAAEKAERQASRDAERQALLASGVRAPACRVEFAGEIVAVKDHYYANHPRLGSVKKATIKTDEGWVCWVTLPSSISGDVKGRRISLTATIKPSDSDPVFGFGSRPTNATIIS